MVHSLSVSLFSIWWMMFSSRFFLHLHHAEGLSGWDSKSISVSGRIYPLVQGQWEISAKFQCPIFRIELCIYVLVMKFSKLHLRIKMLQIGDVELQARKVTFCHYWVFVKRNPAQHSDDSLCCVLLIRRFSCWFFAQWRALLLPKKKIPFVDFRTVLFIYVL